MKERIMAVLLSVLMLSSSLGFSSSASSTGEIDGLRTTLMVGYYHLFQNGAGNGVKITEIG